MPFENLTESDIAARLYPSMPSKPAATGGSLVNGGSGPSERSLAPPAIGEGAVPEIQSLTESEMADRLYGGRDADAGEPLADYNDTLNDFLSPLEYDARDTSSEVELGILRQTREGLAAAMAEHQVGGSEAKALMSMAREHFGTERTPEDVEQMSAQTEADLRRLWGHSYDAKIAAGRRLIDQVARRVPNFKQRLNETGLGSNAAFVRKVCSIAARQPRTNRRV